MKITEIRIKLVKENERSNEYLRAFCSIVFDNCFVVQDLKVIERDRELFVAMPSRKLADHCQVCGCKNHLQARYCNQCGYELGKDRAIRDFNGRARFYADIAHPINCRFRELIQETVLLAYHSEMEYSMQPGYVPLCYECHESSD